jgi:hypothetical protein
MEQTEFLIKFEQVCGVKKPIFCNRSEYGKEGFIVRDELLCSAKEITAKPNTGRYRLTNKNSDVCEIWIDVDNHDGIPFKQYKEERLIPAIRKLNELGISNDYILPKMSGKGVHLHVFVSELPANIDISDLFLKTTTEEADPRSLVQKQKIREFGAITSIGKGFCSYISIAELLKVRQLPIFKEAIFPQIKLFKCSPEFLLSLSLIKADREQQKIEKDVIVDYERDGDFMQLFKCPLITNLAKKSEHEHHLYHNERLFLMCQFIHFGEESRKKLHEIISRCEDYDEKLTQDFIDHAMNANYHPITCKWVKDMRLGCPPDCKGSGGKSPIKFAWTAFTLEELKKTYHKWLCFTTPNKTEDDEILDVGFAIKLERKFQGDPVWLHIVADSGGTKSEILRAISKIDTVDIDSITSHTLISGKIIKDPETGKMRPVKGLLSQLDGKTLIIKDFTIILQSDQKERYLVFSQFRGAYDGYYAAAYGTWDKPIRLECVFTVMTGVTKVIDYHGNLAVILGERFLKLRHDIDRKLATFEAMKNAGKEGEMRKELASKTTRFLINLKIPEDVKLPEKIFNQLLYLALFIAQIRMPVPESSWRSTLVGINPEFETSPEYATRLGKQLLKLSKLLAIVRSREEVNHTDFLTTTRVGFNTCPQNRLKLALYLYYHPKSTLEEISKELHWRLDKTKRMLAILISLDDVLEDSGQISDYTTQYNLSKTLINYMKGFLPQLGESDLLRICVYSIIKHNNTFTTPTLGNGSYGKILAIKNSTEDELFEFLRFVGYCATRNCHRPEPRYPMTYWCRRCFAAGKPLFLEGTSQ